MKPIPLPSSDEAGTTSLQLLLPDNNLLLIGGPVLLAAFLVALAVLYRYELGMVARKRWASFLFVMRCFAVMALFGIIFFRPLVTHSTTEEAPSRVVVLLDVSRSMSVTDPQRTIVEKLQVARSLHWFAKFPPLDKKRIEEGLARQKSGKPLAQDPSELRAYGKLFAAIDGATRLQLARAALGGQGLDAVRRLQARHKVEIVAFHRDAWRIPAEVLLDADDKLNVRDQGVVLHQTDLLTPVERTWIRSGRRRGKIAGVLLFSDGRDNTTKSDLSMLGASVGTSAKESRQETFDRLASLLGQRKASIYPVAVFGATAPPDVNLLYARAPSHALLGADAVINARIQVSGLAAQPIIVEMLTDGKLTSPEHRKIIQHGGADRPYPVRFHLPMKKEGSRKIAVKVRPGNANTKEISTANNEKELQIRVAKDPAKVLVVDGEMRWESHYLIKALERDPMIEVDSVVFDQPRIGTTSEAQNQQSGAPRRRLPEWNAGASTADPLHKYACIILGDVSPDQLPIQDRDRLVRFVADDGGALVIVAGKRWMPHAFAKMRTKDLLPDPLARLLPVANVRVIKPKTGFQVRLTSSGREKPYLQMESGAVASLRRWASLPKHYWAVVGKTKPTAESLAFVDAPRVGPFPRPKNYNVQRNQGLIAQQTYGFGRVLFVGLDSTWRWRYRQGDEYHHRFWGQFIRWAASDRILPAGNEYVRYGTRKTFYERGDSVDVRVRLEEKTPLLDAKAEAEVRFVRIDKEKRRIIATHKLQRDKRRPRHLHAAAKDLPPGNYRVELHIPALGKRIPRSDASVPEQMQRDTFVMLPAQSGELMNLAANWELLRSLSARSGGRVVSLGELDRLIDDLAAFRITRPVVKERKVWHDAPFVWYVFGAILALLSAEWVVRKFVGLS